MTADKTQIKESFLEASFFGRLKTFYFLPPKEKSNRFLPLIIAVMAFLTILGSATGLAIFNATGDWSADLSQVLTGQIVHPDADGVVDAQCFTSFVQPRLAIAAIGP